MIVQPAQVMPVASTSADVNLYVGAAILHGWSWRNSSTVNRAEVELRDGASGPVIVPITLSPGQSTRDWLSGVGIYVRTGLYVAVLSGEISASLWMVPVEDPSHAAQWDPAHAFEDLAETVWHARR